MVLMPLRYIECFLTYGFAGLLLAFSIVKDIKSDLKQFNKIAQTKRSVSHAPKMLSKIIHFDVALRVYGNVFEIQNVKA